MKTLLLILTLLTTGSIYAQQQNAAYWYDGAGNRKQRKLCIGCWGNRPANPDNTTTNTLAANISPNPTKGELAIVVTETTFTNNQKGVVTEMNETHFHVLVYDLYGREIINEQRKTAKFNISLKDKPAGVYIVKLIAGERIKIWEIIKN